MDEQPLQFSLRALLLATTGFAIATWLFGTLVFFALAICLVAYIGPIVGGLVGLLLGDISRGIGIGFAVQTGAIFLFLLANVLITILAGFL